MPITGHGNATGIIIEHGFCNPPITANDGRNYPIYELCQRLNIPVTLSFGGFLGPDVDHNAPKMIDKVAADFPDLVFVLAHGGWPYVQEMAHIAFNRKNVYLSPDIYAVNVPGSTDYLGAMNYFIPEKMIFGSAYPVIGMKDMLNYYKEHLSKYKTIRQRKKFCSEKATSIDLRQRCPCLLRLLFVWRIGWLKTTIFYKILSRAIKKLGLDVWDYSGLPGNVLGQICPAFGLLWFLLMPFAIRAARFLHDLGHTGGQISGQFRAVLNGGQFIQSAGPAARAAIFLLPREVFNNEFAAQKRQRAGTAAETAGDHAA